MGANELSQSFIEAAQLISKKTVESTDAVSVVKAEIIEQLDGGTRQYAVAYGGARYEDAYALAGASYTQGTVVYMLIVDNDFSQKKQILNAVDPSSEQYVEDVETVRNISMSNSLFGDIGQIDLKSWKNEEKEVPYETVFSPNEFQSVFFNYLNLYRRILFSAKIKTEIDSNHQMGGNYGLVLTLYFKNTETEEIQSREFRMDVSTIEGNPYAFLNYQEVNLYYDIEDYWEYIENDQYRPSLKYFVKDFGYADNYESPIEYDIHIRDIEFKVINNLNEENLQGYYLSIIPSNGHYFSENAYATDKILVPSLKVNGQDTSLADWDCYWFLEDGSIGVSSEGYNRFGGIGWRCINEKENVQQDEEGHITFQYVTTNYSQVVKKSDVAHVLRYKCVLVKDEVITNSAIIKLTNLQSKTKTSLSFKNGTGIYKEGVGKIRLLASIKYYYPGVDTFTTSWSRYDKNGVYIDNNFYEKIENPAIYGSDDYGDYVIREDEIVFDCALVDKSNLISCTFYQDRIENQGQDNQNVVRINLGTESLNVSTSPDVTYTLSMINGDVLYKYDADGDSPMVANYDGPVSSIVKNITPITYTIYKPDGNELTPDEYMQVKYRWKIPVNSMIKIDVSYATDQDENYYYIDNYNSDGFSVPYSLNYTIRDTYDKSRSNNTILLEIHFGNIKLYNSVTPQFVKDGESGTNGTKYAAIIRHNGYGYGEISGEGKSQKLHVIYVAEKGSETGVTYRNIGWYLYDINNEEIIPFDAQEVTVDVYKDGTKLSENDEKNPYSVTWSIFDSFYTNPCVTCIKQEGTKKGLVDIRTETVEEQVQRIGWPQTIEGLVIYCSILQCQVTITNDSYEESVYAYYPIEATRLKNLDDTVKIVPRLEDGFSHVLYASDGTNPKFDNNDTFKCIDDIYDAKLLQYNWSVNDNLKILETGTETEPNVAQIKPITQFLNGVTKNYVKVSLSTIDEKKSEINNKLTVAKTERDKYIQLRDLYYKEVEEEGQKKVYDYCIVGLLNTLSTKINEDLFNTYLDKLKNAKEILTDRFNLLNQLVLLNQKRLEIYQYCSSNKISTTDYDYIRKDDTVLNRIDKSCYYTIYLLGNTTNLENVKDRANLSSFKTFFTPTTGENGEAAKIKKNNGAAVLSGLQTLCSEWNVLVKKYQDLWEELVKKNSDDVYIKQDLYNILNEIINGSEDLQALRTLPNLLSNLVSKAEDHSDTELVEFINVQEKIKSFINRLNKDFATLEDGIVISYNDYIEKIIKEIQFNMEVYYKDNTKQEHYKGLSNKCDTAVKEQQAIVDQCNFLLQPQNTDMIVHIRPIVMTANRYELANINAWDGSKLYIDEQNDQYLLAPQVGAGKKDSNNTFTGLVMGIKKFSVSDSEEEIGLFGYYKGVQSLHLNAKDGSASFGVGGDGQILIEPGKDAIIKSGNYNDTATARYDRVYFPSGNPQEQGLYEKTGDNTYQVTSDTTVQEEKEYYRQAKNSGMMINLSKPEIKFGSDNFIVTNEGHLTAKGGGKIAGWEIGDKTLSSGNITIDSTGSISGGTKEGSKWTINNDGNANFNDIYITGVNNGSSFGQMYLNDSGGTFYGSSSDTPFKSGCVTHINDLIVDKVTANYIYALELDVEEFYFKDEKVDWEEISYVTGITIDASGKNSVIVLTPGSTATVLDTNGNTVTVPTSTGQTTITYYKDVKISYSKQKSHVLGSTAETGGSSSTTIIE